MASRLRPASILVTSIVLASSMCMTGGAEAQVTLPSARVDLPVVGLDVADVSVPTNVRDVRFDVRRLRARDLLRAHPDRVTTDPSGELVLRGELLAQPSSADVTRRWADAGFNVRREQRIDELDLDLYVLEPPRGRSLSKALRELRKLDPSGTYDYQHVMTAGGAVAGALIATGVVAASTSTSPSPALTGPPIIRIGMIDAGVDTAHAALRGVDWAHRGCGAAAIPSPHGTAVASLLVAVLRDAAGNTPPLIHMAAADAYCGDPVGGTTGTLIDALAWMVNERVPVINVSLVGPRNALLERAVGRVIANGHVIVAAVGNDGPAAPPLYPAAYEGVIGVTAVDRRGRVLLEACRGKSVDFSAVGADVPVAMLPAGFGAMRGTSFASPQVAALLAYQMPRIDPAAAREALDALAATAIDLGANGRDDIYGLGWVKSPATESPPPPSSIEPASTRR